MRAGAIVAPVVVLVAVPVRGEDKATARAAFADGTRYYDLNKFDDALKAFERAYWNYEDPAFLFNIAQCYRQLDRKRDAVQFYRSYLRKVSDAPNRGEVDKLIASLEASIETERSSRAPSVTSAEKPGAPIVLPLAPGVTKSSTDVAAKETRSPHDRRALRLSGLIVGGVGLAGVAVGATLGALAKDANQQFLQPKDGVYSPTADANRSSYQIGEIVTLCVGGAALIAGTTTYLVGRRR